MTRYAAPVFLSVPVRVFLSVLCCVFFCAALRVSFLWCFSCLCMHVGVCVLRFWLLS